MLPSWNEGVNGTELLPLINLDADTIRCVAGPGSGKTFGAVRRVERILHPEGLAVDGRAVLIVAFNRVIARQLRDEIRTRLKSFELKHGPDILTIHALCVEVIGEYLRMLLAHEIEAMIYDVRQEYPAVAASYSNFRKTEQALRDHEASHTDHPLLWQAVQHWLLRHKAHLVGDLPRLLLERLKGGDFPERGYAYIIVDEFQDLTSDPFSGRHTHRSGRNQKPVVLRSASAAPIGADRELKLAGSGRLRPKRAGPAVRIHLAPPTSHCEPVPDGGIAFLKQSPRTDTAVLAKK